MSATAVPILIEEVHEFQDHIKRASNQVAALRVDGETILRFFEVNDLLTTSAAIIYENGGVSEDGIYIVIVDSDSSIIF